MIAPLVTVADARKHVNDDVMTDAEMELKILEASAAVLKHCKLTEFPDAWSDDLDASPITYTVPFDIQAATFLLLADLCQNRESSTYDEQERWKNLLVGYRDPTLA